MRDRYILRAWPLTPIHVGTGEELTPESFTLDGNQLHAFNGFAALSSASDAEREHYRKLLKGGNIPDAQKHLARLAASRGGPSGERILVGEEALRDLRNVLDGDSRAKAAIRPFIHDGEAVILPGSSVKGALRTAWIDQAASALSIAEPQNPRKTRDEAQALNDRALGIDGHAALQQDPFRDVAVIDAHVPPGRTRYDRATLGKRDGEHPRLTDGETRGIQMHVERLVALADGGVEAFTIEVEIAAAGFVAKRKALGKVHQVPKSTPDATALWSSANRFHAELWRYERARFYGNGPSGVLLDRLLDAFGLTDAADLAGQLDAAGLVLLRVGRYSQFESKAVRIGGQRHGVKAAQKGKPATFMTEGGTRTTVAVNNIATPFGWLMLALPGKGPAGRVIVDLKGLAASRTPSSGGNRSPRHDTAVPQVGAPALAGMFRFRKGDRVAHPDYDGEAVVVRDVPLNATGIDVDFGEGDGPEHFQLAGWTKR